MTYESQANQHRADAERAINVNNVTAAKAAVEAAQATLAKAEAELRAYEEKA